MNPPLDHCSSLQVSRRCSGSRGGWHVIKCTCLQVSLWNFIVYNVVGGGDSALYGVEGRGFYLRNGANQLVAVLPLALLGFPLVAAWQRLRALPGRLPLRVLVAASPVCLWLAALSMLPHKEERFLYVVYPLVRTHTILDCCASLHTAYMRNVGN